MQTRKLQVVGSRSYSLSMPKSWVELNSLKNHDEVFITQNEDNTLTISSIKSQEKQKEITIEIDEVNLIKNQLVFYYMKNYNKVVLHKKLMPYEAKKKVREAMKFLEGFNITEEGENSIEVTFLYKDFDITISKLMQRTIHLLNLEIKSLEQKDIDTMHEAELEIDRLYYLITRILFSSMRDTNTRKLNLILHDEDIFFLSTMSKRLESFADQMYILRDSNLSKLELNYIEKLVSILSLTISSKKELGKLKGELKDNLTKSKDPKINAVFQKMYDFCKDVLEAKINISLNDSSLQ